MDSLLYDLFVGGLCIIFGESRTEFDMLARISAAGKRGGLGMMNVIEAIWLARYLMKMNVKT